MVDHDAFTLEEADMYSTNMRVISFVASVIMWIMVWEKEQ
jgi:hypothetical protein